MKPSILTQAIYYGLMQMEQQRQLQKFIEGIGKDATRLASPTDAEPMGRGIEAADSGEA